MKLRKMKQGYYQFEEMPTAEFLEKYYQSKYFQEGNVNYQLAYSDEELQYKKNIENLHVEAVFEHHNIKKVLDLGCGEGFLLDAFYRKGCEVMGVDFSEHAIKINNSHLSNNIITMNPSDFVKQKSLNSYDCISLLNVMEHVISPDALLENIKEKITNDAILLIKVPNDFSRFQMFLKDKGIVTNEPWVTYPDHLSYFNVESMTNLLTDKGFTILSTVAEYPIDFALLNSHTNYVENKSVGKSVHNARMLASDFLYDTNPKKYLQLLKLLAEMGVGRDISYICKISN